VPDRQQHDARRRRRNPQPLQRHGLRPEDCQQHPRRQRRQQGRRNLVRSGLGSHDRKQHIVNNRAYDSSGAIGLNGYAYFYNSTITGNSATYVGGINAQGPELTLESTILANNTDITVTNDVNRTGGFFNSTNSLFSETFVAADNVINGSNTGNLQGANPQLGAPADNGGTTPTLLPASTSPAIGAGVNLQGYAFDRRGAGFPRNATGPGTAGAVDIGAVQGYLIPPPPPEIVPTLHPLALVALAFVVVLLARRRRPV
jgi:hypothetical protein